MLLNLHNAFETFVVAQEQILMAFDILKHLRQQQIKTSKAINPNSVSELISIPIEVEIRDNVCDMEGRDANNINKTSTSKMIHIFDGSKYEVENFRVGSISTSCYLPDFISDTESYKLLESIDSEGNAKPSVWKTLRTRKLQCWDEKAEALPQWLHFLIARICSLPIFEFSQPPNHVLINRYSADQGILHHVDGPLYHPCVAIISLGSPCLITFRPRLNADQIGIQASSDVFSLCLRPRSLLIFKDSLYTDYMHGIASGVLEEVVEGPAECQAAIGAGDGSLLACVNRDLARANKGEVLIRGLRTSLTIRHLLEELPKRSDSATAADSALTANDYG